MEKTLKTLKDLTQRAICPCCESKMLCPKCKITMLDEYSFIEYHNLRSEAIKHIRQLQDALHERNYIQFGTGQIEAQIEWIKHFFNITEADLHVSDKEKT